MTDLGLLIIRLVVGGLLAGHGAQKLFGSFGGPGVKGAGGWLESMGLKPGEKWAVVAGLSEFGGGLLTAFGFLHPLGPISMLAPMGVATGKVHWDKPIWVTEGGAELPITNIAVATGLALSGPGRYSLDRLFGTRLPAGIGILSVVGVGIGVALALTQPQPPQPSERLEQAGAEF